MKKTMLTIFLAAFATIGSAQSKDDGQPLIDRFFELYKERGYEIAMKYALSTNKWIPLQGDEMTNISIQLGKKLTGIGEYLGYEEIKSRQVGSRIRVASYFVYYERDPIRFTFELYKSTSAWEIADFQFDTKFEDEIEESINLAIDK